MWKRWLPVVTLFFIAVGGVWFWSLGSLPESKGQAIVLDALEGSVEVRAAGGETWQKANAGQTLQVGDRIRVGSGGRAVIRWDGLGESELGANSELLVKSDTPVAGTDERSLGLRLEAGRMWSRLLRLIEVDAGFVVETPEIVATVRGTSFDISFENSRTEVWVTESSVEADSGRSALIVPEGRSAIFTKGSAPTSTARISLLTQDPWRRDNLERDQVFFEASRNALREQVGLDRVPTNRTLQRLSLLSESVHSRFASDGRKQNQAALYVVRRLALARRTAEGGRSGLAYQEWSRFEAEMKARVAGKDGEMWRQVFRTALSLGLRLYDDVMPNTAAYRLKQDLEDARLAVATAPAERLAVQLAIVDSRVTEGRHALRKGSFPDAGQMATIAEQGLKNVNRELDGAELPMQTRSVLRRKAAALLARIEALSADVAAGEQATLVPIEVLPETTTSTATTTLPVVPATSTTPTPPPTVRPVSLNVTPLQATVPIFGQVPFTVRLTLSDGQTRDVTSQAKVTLSDLARGSVIRGLFTAGQTLGPVRVLVTYEQDGVKVSGAIDINVIDR
jgi:hypothetical protein